MINGKFPALPDAYFTVVDVRDVAKLHVESLRKNQSDNKRIIATSPQGINIMEISNICLLYTSPSPRDMRRSRMPSSA